MDFDPRWTDDPRDHDDRELDRGSRGGLSNPRERERLEPRDVFTRDLDLPRGPERQRVRARDSDVRLRGSEVRTLATVGAFRVVPAGDSAMVRTARSTPTAVTCDTCEIRDWSKMIPTIGTRVLSLDEETKLLDALHPRFQRFVRFALGTGCRLDEIRGIDAKQDIDWIRGTST